MCIRDSFKGGRVPLGTFATEEEAWEALARKKNEIDEELHVDPRDGKMEFADYAERWKRSNDAMKLRRSTRNRDFGYLDRYIIPRFDKVALADIDFEMVDEWLVKLRESGGKGGRPLAPSTVLLLSLIHI